jgi:cell division septal protein FtsQ
MWSKKKKTFREELYLPKRQIKKPKRSENVVSVKQSFPWITLSLWTAFLGTVGYMFFFSSVVRMEVLHTEGNVRVPKERIEELFVNEGESKLLKSIRRSNFFLFRSDRLKYILEEEYPAIEEIRITKSFPNKVNVLIRERDIAILWCSRGPCYLIDENNIARAGHTVSERHGELPLYTVLDTGGLSVEIGRTLFDYPFVEYFKKNKELLESDLGIRIRPELASSSRFSDELRLQTEGGWELLINSRLKPEENIKTLRLFFEQEIPFERQGELRNVDLRTENRIYYALKNAPEKEGEDEQKDGEGATEGGNTPKKEEKKKKNN